MIDTSQSMLEKLAAKIGEQAIQIAQLQALLEATREQLAETRAASNPDA